MELLALSKQGINRLDQFTVLSPTDIDSWTYDEVDATTGNVTVKPLMLSPHSLLKHLLNWTNLIIADNGGDTPIVSEWQTYHNGHFMGYISLPRAPPVTPIATAAVTTPTGGFDFKKGNKRNMSVYPDLKDIVNFSTWKLSFDALATKDDLSNVLNETYKPSAGTSQDVFTLQQQFFLLSLQRRLRILLLRTSYVLTNIQAMLRRSMHNFARLLPNLPRPNFLKMILLSFLPLPSLTVLDVDLTMGFYSIGVLNSVLMKNLLIPLNYIALVRKLIF